MKVRSDLMTAIRNRDKDRCVNSSIRCLNVSFDVIGILVLTFQGSQYSDRLHAIRAILGDANQLSRTALHHEPVKSDSQMLRLLQKRINLSKSAAVDFRAARRDDLANSEESQIAVFQKYINLVPVASEGDITSVVAEFIAEVIDKSLSTQEEVRNGAVTGRNGTVIKEVLTRLDGKNLDMKVVSKIVRTMLWDHEKKMQENPSQQL
ncbi:hypothetical protein MMC29_003439 [Sticta canariensis]|nr:hypothetical protein [Sticta canariensis]